MTDLEKQANEWLEDNPVCDADDLNKRERELVKAAWQAALSANGGEAVPYGYLREVDGRVQLSVGPECPPNRSGGIATPWAPIFDHPAPPSVAVPDWANRHTDTPEGWVNELLTLSDHPGKIPSFARDAMRLIAHGLIDSINNDDRAANNSNLNEIKAQTLERFADWLKRQSFAHNKRWTSAANEALRCAKRLRPQEKEEQ